MVTLLNRQIPPREVGQKVRLSTGSEIIAPAQWFNVMRNSKSGYQVTRTKAGTAFFIERAPMHDCFPLHVDPSHRSRLAA